MTVESTLEGVSTMSKSAPSGRTKRARSTGRATIETAGPGPAAPAVSADQRHAMIAERAYLRAAARGFDGGDPVSDWLASEHEVDALLSRSDQAVTR
jgi:hypothetical protein